MLHYLSQRQFVQTADEVYECVRLLSFGDILCQLDKIKREEMVSELDNVGVPAEAIEGILQALTLKSFDDLEGNILDVILMYTLPWDGDV